MARQGNSGRNGSTPRGAGRGKAASQGGRAPLKPVYRRRRLAAIAGILLVLALVFGGFAAISSAVVGAQGPGGDAAANPGPGTPPASPTTSPAASCDRNLVTVTAATDKPAYAAGELPLLSLKVSNDNTVPCEVNIGTSQMEYTIMSGSDRIFSSKDCQAEGTELIKLIPPGGSETANFPWQRNRTVPGCTPVAAEPGAGGAYYVFTARLADKTSPKAIFQLL